MNTPAADGQEAQGMKILQPSDAAKMMIDAIEKNKYRILVGKDSRFMDFLYRLAPQRATKMIAGKMKDLLK